MVWLVVNRTRYKCRSCGETFYEQLPHMDENRFMTQRLITYVEKQSLERTFVSIAQEIGINEKTVRNIFNDYATRLEAEFKFETPTVLGIDEIKIIDETRCVLTDIENRSVLDFLPNRRKKDLFPYFQQLENKENIQYVTMDMWEPYYDAVKEFIPHAIIIIDKFHVVKKANEAMEKLRLEIRKGLDKKKRIKLKNERFTLYRRKHSLSDEEKKKLEVWKVEYPDLYLSYELKETFFEIWDNAKSSEEARQRYFEWRRSIPDNMLLKFAEIIRFMDNWDDVIYNYFDSPKRLTNAYTEGLNSLIRKANDAGRGYSFEALRVKLLFTKGFRKKVQENVGRRFMMKSIKQPTQTIRRLAGMTFSEYVASLSPQQEEFEYDNGVEFSTIIKALEEGI